MLEKYRQIFIKVLELDNEEAVKSASFDKNDNWDSFTQMELLVNLEEEFDITFNAEEVLELLSFDDGIKLLRKKGVDI